MSKRYTKKIPEFVYFVGTGEWIQGSFVNPKKGFVNRKFSLTEIIEEPKIKKNESRSKNITE